MASRETSTSPRRSVVDNPDFIPLALYDLGGAGTFVDVEDVFVRCYELAPDRFGWRKRDYPNYKTIYKALRDFEARHPRLLLKAPDGLSRQLTAEGIAWVEERLPLFSRYVKSPGQNPATRKRTQRLLNELAQDPVVRLFISTGMVELVKYSVADALACAPDSPVSVWKERLESYRAAATSANRPDLVEFLDFVAIQHPEWFGGRPA